MNVGSSACPKSSCTLVQWSLYKKDQLSVQMELDANEMDKVLNIFEEIQQEFIIT